MAPVDGTGGINMVWSTTAGGFSGGAFTGDKKFENNGALKEFKLPGSGGYKMDKGTQAELGYDAVVTWGRWTDGKSQMATANGNVQSMHYFAFTSGAPTIPIVKAFTVFASTAPTLVSAGILVSNGTPNSVTGSLNVNFTGNTGGSATYNFAVPVNGVTYNMTGTATQSAVYGFVGNGVVTSSLLGLGCLISCSGALPGGNSIQGAIGGAGNTRAGIDYGFNALTGKVSGVVVLKSP